MLQAIRQGRINLNDPAVTLALLDANAVVGVSARRERTGGLRSVGIQCALCHSTVDDSFAPGHRPSARRLAQPRPERRRDHRAGARPQRRRRSARRRPADRSQPCSTSWGPGKFDAELFLDGKAFRPDGKTAATLLPAAFGLAGVNLHTYTGWGGVTHWNAFVANLEMHGQGTFFDSAAERRGRSSRSRREQGFGNVRNDPDLVTAKLPALQFYQLSLPAPKPPRGSFDARRRPGGAGASSTAPAHCATCHVPPLFTEPGWNHAHRRRDRHRRLPGAAIAGRALPHHAARAGCSRGRRAASTTTAASPRCGDVVEHYDRTFGLNLSEAAKRDAGGVPEVAVMERPNQRRSAACRNSDGDRPYAWRNAVLKWLWLEKPSSRPSASDRRSRPAGRARAPAAAAADSDRAACPRPAGTPASDRPANGRPRRRSRPASSAGRDCRRARAWRDRRAGAGRGCRRRTCVVRGPSDARTSVSARPSASSGSAMPARRLWRSSATSACARASIRRRWRAEGEPAAIAQQRPRRQLAQQRFGQHEVETGVAARDRVADAVAFGGVEEQHLVGLGHRLVAARWRT